jgi:3-deoxy-manno-octulosonate cytidylyltransferase (CMP-KDO synthetase)
VHAKALAVIPARYGSTRFPGKPLVPIAGVPMVLHVLHNVRAARLVDRVIVATDDARIADVVRADGGEAVMTSPDLPSGSDRVWSAAAESDASIIVNVQGDEPLLAGSVVDALVRALDDAAFDISTPIVATPRHRAAAPDVVTVVRADSGEALYFSRQTIPYAADPVWRHIGVYAYRRGALARFVDAAPTQLERAEQLEQLRALSIGLRIAAVPVDAVSLSVDRPEDVASVERILAGGQNAEGPVIRLLVLDVDGVLTTGDVTYLPDGGQVMGFDVKDGFGIVRLLEAGIDVAVLSSRDSPALRRRVDELGIQHVRAGVRDKPAELIDLAAGLGVALDEVCYIGDDEPDAEAMALCGLSAAPADAVPSVRERAELKLRSGGGHGAVRELCDLLLSRR